MKIDLEIRENINALSSAVAGTEHAPYLADMRIRYEFLLGRLKSETGNGRVLDVGASPGLLTSLMRDLGFDASGLDLHPDKRFPPAVSDRETNLFAEYDIPVVQCNVLSEPFPFGDGTFDAVMMNESIEHLAGPPLHCLREIRRVLKPGGRLYLTTPNVTYLANRLRFLAGRNIHTPIETLVNVPQYKLHYREYTMYELEDLASRAGLSVVEKGYINFGGEQRTGVRKIARAAYYSLTRLWPRGRSNLYLAATPG